MKKVINSRKVYLSILFIIFMLMLLCNILTPKIVDDFSYHFSFATGERITNVFQIFPSMMAHAEKMNGRLIPHFFVQLFEMLPKCIFNVINSLMFMAMVVLVYKIVMGDKKNNNAMFLTIFGAVWVFQPAFGQINLWLDGACNYMWGITFGLLFLIPFMYGYMYGRHMHNIFAKVGFLIFSFLAGAYSENGSAAFIFMAVIFICLECASQHRIRPRLYDCIAVLVSCMGYLTMFLAPAQWTNKSAKFTWETIRTNFMNALEMYYSFYIVLAVFVVMLVLAYMCNVNKKRLVLSLVLLSGSLISNFMMIVASYYAERSACSSIVLLIAATAVLMQDVFEGKNRPVVACLEACMMLMTVYYVCIGLNDIYVTDCRIKENEAYIYACKEQGIKDITLTMFTPDTKYSAVKDLRYLATDTSQTWPNTAMAKYYGVDSIIGQWR